MSQGEMEGYYFNGVIREVLSEEVASELRSGGTKAWAILDPRKSWTIGGNGRQWPRVRRGSDSWRDRKTCVFGQREHVKRVRIRVRLEETPDHIPLTFEAHFLFSFQTFLLLPCYSCSASLADPLLCLSFRVNIWQASILSVLSSPWTSCAWTGHRAAAS